MNFETVYSKLKPHLRNALPGKNDSLAKKKAMYDVIESETKSFAATISKESTEMIKSVEGVRASSASIEDVLMQ